jgi:hypothetical protein
VNFPQFGPEKRKGTRVSKSLFGKKLVLPATYVGAQSFVFLFRCHDEATSAVRG